MLMATPPKTVSQNERPRDALTVDLCIIGAGPGGLALATAAAAFGQKVVLIDKHKLGGTSLNYGTIPLVALHASADRAQALRTAAPFGIGAHEPAITRTQVQAHIASVIESLTPDVASERLAGLGIRVLQAAARFTDPRTVVAGEHAITARRFILAIGSSPHVPPIPGLSDIAVHTTDTIFSERGPIEHLIIVGAGAAGVELAQAHRRLGARVTLLDQGPVLPRLDPEVASVVRARLIAEGTVVLENVNVQSVEGSRDRVRVTITSAGKTSTLDGSHLLVACGRRVGHADIGTAAAKIAVTDDAIKVNRYLRTSNHRVYAMGDCIGLPHSAHRAEYHATALTRTLLYRKATAVDPRLVPGVIHTDPELATVGLSEKEARARFSSIQVYRWPMRDNPRALANRTTEGHIKVITDSRGAILGAALVARGAGELIQVWSLALSKGLSLEDMTAWVAPFPSLGDINRKSATHRSAMAAGHTIQRQWVRLLAKLG
jgi:pyruvate/2-oxoglutarate dehydrogenase complex dihydrolipoamide dehydrogenase (E3) component